MALILEV